MLKNVNFCLIKKPKYVIMNYHNYKGDDYANE